MDRRHRWRVRIAFTLLGVLLGVAALWSTGADPMSLINWWRGRVQIAQVAQPSMMVATRAAAPESLPAALPGTDSSVSAVPLSLILTSTAPGRSVQEGFATIGVTRQNLQTYTAGAVLANGARLAQVHPTYVVLERDGQSARLYLEGAIVRHAVSSDPAPLLSVQRQKRSMATAVNSTPLTSYLRLNPLYDGDSLRGYEVYAGNRSSVFSQMGLQPRDVITSVEGAALSNAAYAYELFQSLMDGMAMTVTVERRGERLSLTLDGSLILADQEAGRHVSPAAFTP
jgi:type II secretion system protein C